MKIVQINSVCGIGSTGRICTGIAEVAKEHGHECKIAYGRMKAPSEYDNISFRIESDMGVKVHALKTRLFGKTGTYSKSATEKFLTWLDEYSPDIIHLHNLHGYYINVPMLFEYIKKNNIRTVWTLHDCWAFTGHCAYFDMAGCEKWKSRCRQCSQTSEYPKSIKDSSEDMYDLKKLCFTDVHNMTIVTPSRWLAELVQQSFLSDYDIRVIYNGINLDIFKPTESNIKKRLACDGKKMVLGVAFQWDKRKGLDVFIELADRLSSDYQIVLVGVSDDLQKKLPENIIAVSRTCNQTQLAEFYSAADVFVNPTRQEVLGLVNIEALSCGTPVITFDTGGSPETIDENSGEIVIKNDIDAMEKEIKKICENSIFSSNSCVEQAKKFDYREKFKEYIELYSELLKGENK